MVTISIRIKDETLDDLNRYSERLDIPKSEYIRQAVIAMNKQVEKELRRTKIMEASKRVRDESMRINTEFDAVEDAPDV